ncbi:hypothetical protein BDN70DRAFT_952969 [Pholiota conissans]|uniref:F-box domain-containing protein n=1 Tax=Pholiota conissans TaxID=109636 RepID=A0A9P5Z9S1_9AGAR|nr:hypothetical protein BDN70DRAFT_952969 [Pholiota conissans]
MNQVHDPLATKLPAEVVSTIFTNFAPITVSRDYGIPVNRPEDMHSGMERTTPLLLAAVCTAWRALAWSTPQLWSTISVDISCVNGAVVDILREWLNRSGDLPLYIEIHADLEIDYHKLDRHEISNVFAEYAPRWFYMELNTALNFFSYIHPSIADARILSTLKVETFSFSETLDFHGIPNLKTIPMDVFPVGKLTNLNWKNLTTVEGGFRHIDLLFELLSDASCLTHLIFYLMSSINGHNAQTTRNTAVQHDHLTYLNISTWTKPMDFALPWLKFPFLEHLVVPKQTAVVVDLVFSSGCALKTLDTYVTSDDPAYDTLLIPFLEAIPSLESMGLIDGYSGSSDPVLSRLSKSTDIKNQESSLHSSPFLPNLKTLYITYIQIYWSRVLDLLPAYPDDIGSSTSAIRGSETTPEKNPTFRPLRTLHIRLWSYKDSEPIDLDTAQRIQYAINHSSVEVTIALLSRSSNKRIPLQTFLQRSLSPSVQPV